MAEITRYVSLRDCIYMYSESAKKDDTAYMRLRTMAFLGYQQMLLNDFAPAIRQTVSINENKTVTFPDNLIQWRWIYPPDNSYISEFKRGSRTIEKENEFLVDNGFIKLHTSIALSEVQLEYIPAPENDDDFLIPMEYQMAMIAFLSWQDVANLPSTGHVGNSTIQMRAKAYRAQLDLARKTFNPVRKEDLYNYKKTTF